MLRRKAVVLKATCPLEACTTVASATGKLRNTVTVIAIDVVGNAVTRTDTVVVKR